MIGTNIYISQETQESLIKAAALKKISIEELASSILKESILEKLGTISYSSENKGRFSLNPLVEMQPLVSVDEKILACSDVKKILL